MMTITNKLSTTLVVPDGLGEKGALSLAPKATAQVEKITAGLKEAEKQGLLGIAYPATRKASKTKPAPKPDGRSESLSLTGETN